MPILFCNVGWMNHYDGNDGDSIQRGGSYNKKKVGHEVCNFTPCNGRVYGYVQPTGRIAVERLGATESSDHADDVTVIWTAGPATGGTTIVGCYKNATVFRDLQPIPNPSEKHQSNNLSEYRIVTLEKNATLIPTAERDFLIPRGTKGGIGQSNVWYAEKPESATLVSDVMNYVSSGMRTDRLLDLDAESSAFEGNPRLVAHLRRERSRSLIKQKKRAVLSATGKLCCEVCGFDFKITYGEHGHEFCEVHHLKPIGKMGYKEKTRLTDLAIVCSNCHRIVHRIHPMPTMAWFKKLVAGTNSD